MGDCGWASALLSWGWRGALLVSEISTARYFVRCDRCETTAWAELRDPGGRRRVEIGSFGSVALARAACERDAARRCRRDGADGDVDVRVDVRVSPGRRRGAGREANKGRELAGVNYRPRAPGAVAPARDVGEALDEALRAFADVIEK